jgi:predicted Zn finger-like uncharacterized protein
MASARITCPDCKSVLRPAKLVPDGKKVKCPKCGKMFTTPGLMEEEDRPRKKETTKKEAIQKEVSKKKSAKAAIKKAGSPPPSAKPSGDDDDDGGAIYSYISEGEKADEDKPDIEYAPDMSIKDLRGPAQAAVVAPSNYMLLIGGVSCLCNIFIICYSFWPMVFSDSVVNWQAVLEKHYKGKGDKNAESRIGGIKEYKDLKDQDLEIVHDAEHEEYIYRFILMGSYILVLIYNGITIIGAVKMQNLESRGWGIASSIMTLLPLGPAGISGVVGGVFYNTIGAWILEDMNVYYSIGLSVVPYLLAILVGVWSLRTLMSQEVIDGFEYIAE